MTASKRNERGSRQSAKPSKQSKPVRPGKPAQPAAGKGKPAPGKPKPPVGKPAAAAKPAAEPKPPAVKPPPRAQLLPKLFKALRSTYKTVPVNTSRPLLEQVLFACCLENARAEAADKALSRLLGHFTDLNEVRVTTVAELGETLTDLPDPARASLSLRRALQSVFESTYNFSLEHLRKQSLANATKTLEGLHGVPPFVVQYVVSTALGGHAIPLDHAALAGLYVTGLITQQEYDAGKVPGLERLIPKKSGGEFSALLHVFGVDCLGNLHGAAVKKVVQAVNPAAKDRFPKRGENLPVPNPPPPPPGREGQRAAEAARVAAEEHRPAGPQAAARPAGKTPLPPPGAGPKRAGEAGSGKPGPKPFVVKPNVGKPITIKPQTAAPPPPAAKKPEPEKKPAGKPAPKHSTQLAKRKPR